MILTVTINPLLEHRLFFEQTEPGKPNRSLNEKFCAGGKGINVSRQLNMIGIKNSAFTFLGGNNGKSLRHCLSDDKIDFSVVSAKSETRIAEVIIEEKHKRVSTFFGLNSQITDQESAEFKSKLEKMIQNCSIVVFAGSSPCKETDDIFPFGIELANKHDKISILDTYGAHLNNCIDAEPTVIHNNIEEIRESLAISIDTENEKLDFLRMLYSRNIKMAFLTDGSNPAYASKFDFHYKIVPPQVDVYDATGSGDAFTAGIAYGLEEAIVFDEFVKIASALGAVNASQLKTCEVSLDMIEDLVDKVEVTPVGKKMKIIDDSPNYK
ncbi:MAG: 1-phosphofructokinase [Ignavibacteriae bacterium HGW-Ignavibacteriae-3]|nr:MAG: 1-phosphofructokinase [Ignavibacteriae bacterium HGW-Ignavibacteriae-3]